MCSGSYCQNLMKVQNKLAEVSRFDAVKTACLLLSWVQSMAGEQISFHDRFSWFSCLETVKSRKMDGSEAISLAGAQCGFWNDSQSSSASLKKLRSESNNGVRGDEPALESKHIWVDRVFNVHVLRILLSEFYESLKQTSFGIKVSCCASGMSVIIMGAEHGWWTDFVSW